MNSTGEPTQRNGDSTSLTGRFVIPVTYRQANEKSSSPAGEPSTVRERSAAPGDQSQMTSERCAAPHEAPKAVTNFTTILATFVDPGLEAFLIDNGVEITGKPIQDGGSPLATLLFGFGPAQAPAERIAKA
jgi:cell division protease FtsH